MDHTVIKFLPQPDHIKNNLKHDLAWSRGRISLCCKPRDRYSVSAASIQTTDVDGLENVCRMVAAKKGKSFKTDDWTHLGIYIDRQTTRFEFTQKFCRFLMTGRCIIKRMSGHNPSIASNRSLTRVAEWPGVLQRMA